MVDDNRLQNLGDDAIDFTHETTKFLASLIPVVGYLHAILVKSPAERRLVRAVSDLAIELEELRSQYSQLTTEYLSNHPVFITAASNVMLISIREHREEKLQALRNIALNTALPNDTDEDMQLMFIEMVDSFTTWHLRILRFFANDNWWGRLGHQPSDRELDPIQVAEKIKGLFPSISDDRFLYKIINDLMDNQLITHMRIDDSEVVYLTTESDESSDPDFRLKSLLTSLGKEFMKFATSPLKK